MKKLSILLLAFLLISGSAMAQRSKGKKKKRVTKEQMDDSQNNNRREKTKPMDLAVRADNDWAITGELGWNSLAGFGINVTKYVTPNVAVDLGLGLGLQLFKSGLRGRYFFTKKKFAPYAGLGVIYAPLEVEGIELDSDGDGVIDDIVNLNSSLYAQLTLGFEYMSRGGFVFGMNVGYAPLLQDNYDEPAGGFNNSETKVGLDLAYGSGIVFGANMGFAF